jgi:hypothetical protein
MLLKELLLQFIPSNEIKSRVKNKQIKINNDIIDNINIEIDIIPDYYLDLADFVYYNIEFLKNIEYFGIENLIGSDTNIEKYQFLTEYYLLTISKKEKFVFFKL